MIPLEIDSADFVQVFLTTVSRHDVIEKIRKASFYSASALKTRLAMQSAVLAMIDSVVRPSVRPSRSVIRSK